MSPQERQLALQAAVQSIEHDKMSIRAAAKFHGVAKTTLSRYFRYSKKIDPNFVKASKKSLPPDEF